MMMFHCAASSLLPQELLMWTLFVLWTLCFVLEAFPPTNTRRYNGWQRQLRHHRFFASSTSTDVVDPYDSFSPLDKLLFQRFSASVAAEMGTESSPQNYGQLMELINKMTTTRSTATVHDQGKNMLVRLFPKWLLEQYQWMFAAPFPRFSAWMNAYVTHWTTNWLMGNSTIYDLELSDGTMALQQGLLVEKCRFLESSGCVQTCLHACKIPTQRFFLEEMGLPVTLRPNMTDYSCRFEFGVKPVPLEEDDIVNSPCLDGCPTKRKKKVCLSSSLDGI